MKSKELHMVAVVLVVVGAVNWGLVGMFQFDVVELLLGAWPMLVNFVYILVGLSGIYLAVTHREDCKVCSGKKK